MKMHVASFFSSDTFAICGVPRCIVLFRHATTALALTLVAGLSAACSMVGSSHIDGVMAQTCHSDAGLYFLSRTYLQVKIESHDIATVPHNFISSDGIKVVHLPDKSAPFCIDYLASPTSEDTVVVQRAGGLLKQINTNAKDQSVEIAKTLIKALFAGISQNPAFNANQSAIRALKGARIGKSLEFEALYDPFDEAQVRNINNVVKDFGFCLVLDHLVPDGDIESYCSNPLAHQSRENLILASTAGDVTPVVGGYAHLNVPPMSYEAAMMREGASCRLESLKDEQVEVCDGAPYANGPPAFSQGIYYRARLPYSYSIYVRPNLKVMSGWQLRGVETVELENDSPVFNVAVDRTYFAERKTTLKFDNGVLQDVEIEKKSELAGFVQIPLVLAQSIAALPTNIVQVRIDMNNNREKLIKAQTELIQLKEKQAINKAALKKAEAAAPRSFGGAAGSQLRSLDGAVVAGGSLGEPAEVYRMQCLQVCADDDATCGKHCSCIADCTVMGNDMQSCQSLCPRVSGTE